LALPATAQGPATEALEALPLDKQLAEGLITEKEYDLLAPVQSCSPDAAWPGPDGFGYTGATVDYNWVDITTSGTPITGLTDDNYVGPFPLGFTFFFYGAAQTEFYAASNGYLTLGSGYSSLSNQCPLPNSSQPNDIVSMLWDDLNFNTGGSAYYQTFDPCPVGTGACTVVEYYQASHYGGAAGSAGTWEAIFYADGNLMIQFLDAGTEEGSGSTTGIEDNNAAGDWGLTYACNVAASITDGLAIQFTPPPPAPRYDESGKAAPGEVLPGQPIDYTITILNTGNAPGLATTMVDPVPAGTVYNGDVACSSGSCSFDGTNVLWSGQVAVPPKAASQPPQNADGRQAKGPDGPANPTGERSVFPKVNGTVLLDQQPNQSNGIFSDASCDLCAGAQVLAENFALEDTATLEQVVFWTGYYPYDTPIDPDAIRVLIHQDAAGLPGTVVYDESNVAYTRAQTGVILFGVHEWLHTLTLGTPAVLPAGTYWIEIYNDTGWGTDDMFWEAGNADTIGRGLPDSAFAFEAPGVSWYYPNGYDMAFQLIGTIGMLPPENPVTVTFSVTPVDPPCGATFLNEATISDPDALFPVTVSASTELVNPPYYAEDLESSDGGYTNMGTNLFTWGPPPQNPQAHSGANAWATDMPYAYSAWYELWSPWIDLSGADPIKDLVLSWWQDIYIESASYDHAYVEITTDEINWSIVWQHTGGTYHSPGWEKRTGDITPYIGQQVKLRFRLTSDTSVSYDGWAIDDVSIASGCQVFLYPDIEVTPLELNATLCPDTQETQQLTICNVGDVPLTWDLTEVVPPKGTQDVLWDNGPMVTHPSGGYNGNPASALQTALGMNTYGFGNQYYYQYRMADDFEITEPAGCQVDQVTFYAYQTGTYGYPPVSTMTGLYYQIWDGSPDDPGSSVVFGDLVTNRMTSTGWSGIYRVLDTALTDSSRPIMADVASAGVHLPPGTYWLEWMTDGSGASGPWAPPITILGQTTTGNGLQYTTAWAAALDTGTSTQQGLPFVVEGTCGPPPDLTWLSEDPLAGTVDPGQCQAVDVTFDSTGLTAGTYLGSLDIDSNDPDEPTVNVPVQLTVQECGNTLTCGLINYGLMFDPYGRELIKWWVEAVDQYGAIVPLVTVDADLTWPTGGPVSRTRLTHYDGYARFHWGSNLPGTWTIDVTNMTLAGYTFVDGPQCSASAVGK